MEITEVQLLRDLLKPVISLDPIISGPTNNKNFSLNIEDASRVKTLLYINESANQLALKQNGFLVSKEGVNVIRAEATDSFGNKSQFSAEINLDLVSPTLVSLSPVAGSNVYTHVLPYTYNIEATFSEVLSELKFNESSAVLASNGSAGSAQLTFLDGGAKDIRIAAKDVAGNVTSATSSLNLIYWNTPPKITTSIADTTVVNQTSINIPVQLESEIPINTTVKINNIVLNTYTSKNFQFMAVGLIEGANSIEISSVDAAGNIAIPQILNINVDTKAPQIIAVTPTNGKVYYTNKLPITIPVTANFNEAIVRGSVNSIAALLTGPTSISGQVEVAVAGAATIAIEVVDFAGNISTVSETVTIAYSNTPPKITLDESVIDLLTNETLINFFGTADRVLASATLNDIPINIGQDGISFSGIFQVPKDGRFEIKISVTDLFGNTSIISTFARIIQALPDVLKNFQPPTLIPKPPIGYVADYGPHLGRTGSPNCAAMSEIFSTVTEFSGNLRGITEIDPKPFIKKFPAGYRPRIPDMTTVKRFVGEFDEKLNSLKIAYLANCEGFNFILDPDCETGREAFRIVMRKYPEPMIIGSIPGLTVPLKNFLIKRFNICTGLDSSGLSCKDLVELLPGLAAYAAPAVGNLLSTPVAQFILEEAACKNICEGPLKDTPACTTLPIPVIPEIKPDIIVSFTPDLPNMGGGSRFPDLGGGSDCNWWESCGSGYDDGGGSNHGGNAVCDLIPGLWFCAPVAGDRMPRSVPVDAIDCNAISNLNLLDIFSNSFNSGSTISFLTSIVANCVKTPVDGFPKNRLPVITLSAPLDQQAVTDTVRVIGKVDDTSSVVTVNGVKVDVSLGDGSVDFDVVIPVPVSGVVKVEAQDSRGNLAVPVVVGLVLPVTAKGNVTDVSAGMQFTCAVVDGYAYCWGSNYQGQLGDGTLVDKLLPTRVLGITEKVIQISAGRGHACAVTVSGKVQCWGANGNGNLGDGTFDDSLRAVTVVYGAVPLTGATDVVTGSGHTCALISDKVMCWGNGLYGQLGDGKDLNRAEVAYVLNENGTIFSGVSSISTYMHHVCAVKNSMAFCWGDNSGAGLGTGDLENRLYPTPISGINENVTFVTTGFSISCAVMGGKAKCWGSNESGQLGDGTRIGRLVPTTVLDADGIPMNGVLSIASGDYNNIFNTTAGLKVWGDPGLGSPLSSQPPNVTTPVAVVTASNHACVIIDQKLKCWGQNRMGELGNGTVFNSKFPVDVVNFGN